MNAERDRTLFESEAARSLITGDFVEFGVSGKVWSKAEIVAALPEWPASERKLEDFRVRDLCPSVCLATYRIGSSLRSSIWRRGEERWQIIFHQGTGVA